VAVWSANCSVNQLRRSDVRYWPAGSRKFELAAAQTNGFWDGSEARSACLPMHSIMSLTKEGPGDVRWADVSQMERFGVASIGGHRMVRPAADLSLQLATLLIRSACAAAPAISEF
jgi:hypothetical protein